MGQMRKLRLEWSLSFPIPTDGKLSIGKDENKALRFCHTTRNLPFLTSNQKLKMKIPEQHLDREMGTGSNATAASRQFLSNKWPPV